MRKTSGSLGESLVEEGLLRADQLRQIEAEMKRTGEPLQRVLRRLHFIDEKKLVQFLSDKFRLPLVEITHQIIRSDVLKLIPQETARKFLVFPIMKIGNRLTLASCDPFNLTLLDQLRLNVGLEIEPVLATEDEIRRAIEQYYGVKSGMSDVVESLREEPELVTEKGPLQKQEVAVEEAPIIRLVNTMISEAVRDGASDIHVSPEKDTVTVRLRVDGILHELERHPKILHAGVVSRVKVMANLDISESRMPQDGRVRIEVNNLPIDLRISVMPTIHGENLVIRLLNLQSALLSPDQLGMAKEQLVAFQEVISKPYGMLLITGPTGSGKTTTLYAALNQLNSPERNIVTIEDPVEYQLPTIRQIQVSPKVNLTFVNGLRSILRQDPDIIMVGEIRDKETAEIAIQAALTGHFVFSTLHTKDAASAVTRLLDMGVEPFLVASTITAVIGQRLVRTICVECREAYTATSAEVGNSKLLQSLGSSSSGIKLYRGRGCLNCKKTGYRGRLGLFELLIPDKIIRKMILTKSSSDEIKRKTAEEGIKTFYDDGVEKVKQGITTVEEVVRVIYEE